MDIQKTKHSHEYKMLCTVPCDSPQLSDVVMVLVAHCKFCDKYQASYVYSTEFEKLNEKPKKTNVLYFTDKVDLKRL